MNIEKIAAHQIDPVRDIWMKGSSQGKISGWIQTFEIEENLEANTNTNTLNKQFGKANGGSKPLKLKTI